MSDNIDYAELDKAVNEAIKARQNEPTPAKTTTPIAVRKTAPVAVKPVARGHIMDFAPRKNAQRVTTQPLPTPKPAAQPSVHPTYTVTHTVTTVPRPAIVPRSAKPIHTGATVSDMKPVAHHPQHSVAAQIQKKQQKVEQAAIKAAPKPVARPAVQSKPIAKPVAQPKPATTPKPVATPTAMPKKEVKSDDAPNANNYSLGVRSPFLTNTKVEKHPLGINIPETSATALRSTHNIYSEKSPTKAKTTHHKKKQVVAEAPKKHTGWLWALLVILIIAAGAGLGYLAYTLVFAN